MSNSNLTPPGDKRRRKLDDLFGNEPYLSPTMRARRLNDDASPALSAYPDSAAATASSSARVSVLDLAPQISDEDAGALWRRRTENGAEYRREHVELAIIGTEPEMLPSANLVARSHMSHSSPTEPTETLSFVPLSQAAAFLRAELPEVPTTTCMAPLHQFRIEVLSRWLKHVPKREHDGTAEEY